MIRLSEGVICSASPTPPRATLITPDYFFPCHRLSPSILPHTLVVSRLLSLPRLYSLVFAHQPRSRFRHSPHGLASRGGRLRRDRIARVELISPRAASEEVMLRLHTAAASARVNPQSNRRWRLNIITESSPAHFMNIKISIFTFTFTEPLQYRDAGFHRATFYSVRPLKGAATARHISTLICYFTPCYSAFIPKYHRAIAT